MHNTTSTVVRNISV